MSGLPESDTAASFHEPHDEVPCPIIKCCAAVPPISATTMSAASTTKRATINPVLLSTRPAIQFGVSSPQCRTNKVGQRLLQSGGYTQSKTPSGGESGGVLTLGTRKD